MSFAVCSLIPATTSKPFYFQSSNVDDAFFTESPIDVLFYFMRAYLKINFLSYSNESTRNEACPLGKASANKNEYSDSL